MCALPAPTTRAKRICKRHSGLHFRRNQSPDSTIRPTSPIQHPQNPSGADRNPIGRSPRPSQTPATYFKRPYRNCPGEESCAQSRLLGRGSPDRDLSFTGTDRGLLRLVLGPWSPVPKCEALGAHFSGRTHFHGTQAPPPKSESSASKILRHSGTTVAFKPTFEVFTRVGPDNSLECLTECSVGLVTDRPSNVDELCVTLL